jgi:hypothetical protein
MNYREVLLYPPSAHPRYPQPPATMPLRLSISCAGPVRVLARICWTPLRDFRGRSLVLCRGRPLCGPGARWIDGSRRARRFLTQLIILQDCLQRDDLTGCSPQGVLRTAPLILVERPDCVSQLPLHDFHAFDEPGHFLVRDVRHRPPPAGSRDIDNALPAESPEAVTIGMTH